MEIESFFSDFNLIFSVLDNNFKKVCRNVWDDGERDTEGQKRTTMSQWCYLIRPNSLNAEYKSSWRWPCPKKHCMALLSQVKWCFWHFNQWAYIMKRQTRAHATTHPFIDCCMYLSKAVQNFTHLINHALVDGLLFCWQVIWHSSDKIPKEWASPLCSWEDQWFVFLQTFVWGHNGDGIELIFF